MSYARRDVAVELRFDAVTPPDIVSAKGMSEFFAGHIDQAGRYTGALTLGGRRHAIDCFGIRDRSWGARIITDDIRMNYCHGQSEQLAFVCYSKPGAHGEEVFKGYLARDGKRLGLAGGTRRSIYSSEVLERVELEIVDTEGRRIRGSGVPVNRMVYEPYPNLITWLHLMRWEIDGAVIYGEEQDVWSVPLWHARDRSARI